MTLIPVPGAPPFDGPEPVPAPLPTVAGALEPPRPVPATPPFPGTVRFFVDIPPTGVLAGAAGAFCAAAKVAETSHQ